MTSVVIIEARVRDHKEDRARSRIGDVRVAGIALVPRDGQRPVECARIENKKETISGEMRVKGQTKQTALAAG